MPLKFCALCSALQRGERGAGTCRLDGALRAKRTSLGVRRKEKGERRKEKGERRKENSLVAASRHYFFADDGQRNMKRNIRELIA